jgi:hypothetical protein
MTPRETVFFHIWISVGVPSAGALRRAEGRDWAVMAQFPD